MSKVVVTNHVTLDGVMQSPAAPDEDTRGGFSQGGWATPRSDEEVVSFMGKFMGKRMRVGQGDGRLLLGRRTYEHFAAVWPHMPSDNPYTEVINRQQKLVASRTLAGPLAWNNSSLLSGDVAEAVAALRDGPGESLVVLGSGELLQTLIRHHLVDEFLLIIHPIVLGTGRRLFPDGGVPTTLTLQDSTTTAAGVIMASYASA